MKLLTIFISALLLSTSVSANPTMNTCEEAITSNSLALLWQAKWGGKARPTNFGALQTAIADAQWCIMLQDRDGHKNHWEIFQYQADGTRRKTKLIANSKDDSWIKSNMGKFTRVCTMPYELTQGETLFRTFANGEPCKITGNTFLTQGFGDTITNEDSNNKIDFK